MKKYIQRLRAEKTPHERRQISMQVAGVMTAILFVGWVGTLGVRLAQSGTQEPVNSANTAATLIAVQGAASSTSTWLPGY